VFGREGARRDRQTTDREVFEMARLILIHGGSHGAWCWERVLEPLRDAGHEVEAPNLPGRGDDAHLATTVTLEDWVSHMSSVIDAGPTPVVLVAHSMGGLTASQLAERRPADVARIVYVAALVPGDGEAGLAALQQAGGESLLLAPGAMQFSEDQALVLMSRDTVRRIFYSSSADADADWAMEQINDEAFAPLTTSLTLTANGFGTVAKTYIVTTLDQAIPAAAQRIMAQGAGADTIEIAGDHSPFVSAVDLLVKAVDWAARQ
jgi:pimeloyl-ACP methyl ester carboxylesterase